MEIDINGLVSVEEAVEDTENVLEKVDSIGKVVVMRDDKPSYLLMKYEEEIDLPVNPNDKDAYALQDAMEIVLLGVENRTLHASKLADRIYDKRLYLKENGEKATMNEIRAQCDRYPAMFETLPGNYIKLKIG